MHLHIWIPKAFLLLTWAVVFVLSLSAKVVIANIGLRIGRGHVILQRSDAGYFIHGHGLAFVSLPLLVGHVFLLDLFQVDCAPMVGRPLRNRRPAERVICPTIREVLRLVKAIILPRVIDQEVHAPVEVGHLLDDLRGDPSVNVRVGPLPHIGPQSAIPETRERLLFLDAASEGLNVPEVRALSVAHPGVARAAHPHGRDRALGLLRHSVAAFQVRVLFLGDGNRLVDCFEHLAVEADDGAHELHLLLFFDVLADELVEHRVELVALVVGLMLRLLDKVPLEKARQVIV